MIIVWFYALFIQKGALKQSDTDSAISKEWDYVPSKGKLRNSIKSNISLVIVIHLGVPWCDVAFCLLGCCIMCSAIMLPDRVSRD